MYNQFGNYRRRDVLYADLNRKIHSSSHETFNVAETKFLNHMYGNENEYVPSTQPRAALTPTSFADS